VLAANVYKFHSDKRRDDYLLEQSAHFPFGAKPVLNNVPLEPIKRYSLKGGVLGNLTANCGTDGTDNLAGLVSRILDLHGVGVTNKLPDLFAIGITRHGPKSFYVPWV
jgi:hypothetical protein